MKIERVAGIYILIFVAVIFLGKRYPSQLSVVLNTFTPSGFGFSESEHVRFRMSLFFFGTMTFIMLVPFIWRYGFYGANILEMKRLSAWYFLYGILITPIIWIGYPFVATCADC